MRRVAQPKRERLSVGALVDSREGGARQLYCQAGNTSVAFKLVIARYRGCREFTEVRRTSIGPVLIVEADILGDSIASIDVRQIIVD